MDLNHGCGWGPEAEGGKARGLERDCRQWVTEWRQVWGMKVGSELGFSHTEEAGILRHEKEREDSRGWGSICSPN